MSTRRKSLAFGLGACVCLTSWMLLSDSQPDETARSEHLVNHPWLERIPRNEKDMITQLAVLGPVGIGVMAHASRWRGQAEGFRWRHKADRLHLFFPQDETRARLRVKTWECAGEAPKPFDICLELRRGDRHKHLYSRKDWVIEVDSDGYTLGEWANEQPLIADLVRSSLAGANLSALTQVQDPDGELPERSLQLFRD